jgi:hypothetical protein
MLRRCGDSAVVHGRSMAHGPWVHGCSGCARVVIVQGLHEVADGKTSRHSPNHLPRVQVVVPLSAVSSGSSPARVCTPGGLIGRDSGHQQARGVIVGRPPGRREKPHS